MFSPALLAVGLLLAATTLSCESDPQEPSPSDARQDEDQDLAKKAMLEKMDALGYVSWSSSVDPNLSGVTRLDLDRAAPGYNLYGNGREVFLLDMEGNQVKSWPMPRGKRKCARMEMLPDARLLVICDNRSLTLMNWDGTVVWELEAPVHHDMTALPGGGFAALVRIEHPYQGTPIFFDEIITISPEGEQLRRWSTFENLDLLHSLHDPVDLDKIPPPDEVLDPNKPRIHDYYHTNTVEALPATPLGDRDPRFREGNLLVSFRNANMIAVMDPETFEILWHWGTDTLELQHMPTMLPDGNILIFDNGVYREASRVLEIRPPDGDVVWKYEGDPPKSFFSLFRGSNQRLSNGNTLICEGHRGRAIEVTPDGEIVWEFWNPEIRRGRRKRISRLMRVPPEVVEPLLARSAEPGA
jgi:outer membrane protein assembly factor BamB